MFLKLIILFLSIFILGCSGSGKKNYNTINLIEYLPKGNIGTVYTNFFTHTHNDTIIEKIVLTKKTQNCITFNVQLLKNNHIESEFIEQMCIKNNKLYFNRNFHHEPLVDLNQKYWNGYKMFIDGEVTSMTCQVESTGTMIFDKNKHNTFTVECKAKNMVITFLYAKNLGLVKTVQSVNDYGVVGGIELKRVEIK